MKGWAVGAAVLLTLGLTTPAQASTVEHRVDDTVISRQQVVTLSTGLIGARTVSLDSLVIETRGKRAVIPAGEVWRYTGPGANHHPVKCRTFPIGVIPGDGLGHVVQVWAQIPRRTDGWSGYVQWRARVGSSSSMVRLYL